MSHSGDSSDQSPPNPGQSSTPSGSAAPPPPAGVSIGGGRTSAFGPFRRPGGGSGSAPRPPPPLPPVEIGSSSRQPSQYIMGGGTSAFVPYRPPGGVSQSALGGGVQIGGSTGPVGEGPRPPPLGQPPQRQLQCALCPRTFDSEKSLSGHMRTHEQRAWRGSYPPPIFGREEFEQEGVGHLLNPLLDENAAPVGGAAAAAAGEEPAEGDGGTDAVEGGGEQPPTGPEPADH